MISVTDLRAGTVFEDPSVSGQIFQVLSYEHIKMGRGSANIKVKVKNVITGSITDKSFINGARVNEIFLAKRELQFLYKDKDLAYFMDPFSFEQINIPLLKLDGYEYLKEGRNFSISFLDNSPLFMTLPPKMEFKVIDTGSSVRGNSATNVFKDAILENGLKTKVPLFIEVGNSITIDTRTGEYSQKA